MNLLLSLSILTVLDAGGSWPAGQRPQRLAQVSGHSRGYLTTPQELELIGQKADLGLEPYATARDDLLAHAADVYKENDPRAPYLINIKGSDIDTPRFLPRASRKAYALAIAYHLLKDSDPATARKYANRAYELVMAMPWRNTQVSGYQANTRLNLSVYTQTFVYAADLLADWPVPGVDNTPFYQSADNQLFKEWLGRVIFRYPYNVAHTRANNWGAWGRLTTAVIGDYVGSDAPLYAQSFEKASTREYVPHPDYECDAGKVKNCVQIDGAEAYATALRLHFEYVDGRMVEISGSSCDANGSKSMIRPDGGMPDELRRQYSCDATEVPDPDGAAANYSQFATESMVALAELAWRRGNPLLYTHINPVNQRGALYRSIAFMLKNNLYLKKSSMLEMVNRFYTYQLTVERNPVKRAEFKALLEANLPEILKQQGNWPAGPSWISFGTLTHGFAAGE
ncbi:MAG: alginate lyase family protein, partial [Anaerolineales bacterium]